MAKTGTLLSVAEDQEGKTPKIVTPSYPLPVTEFINEVRKGNVLGQEIKQIIGENSNATTTLYDIWNGGTNLSWLTSAQTLEVISDNANDTAAGTGARSVIINGLDANFLEISETIATNGLSASVATSQSFIRVNEVIIETVGTYTGSNIGNITVQVSGAGAILAYIDAGEGRDNNTHFTVPAGKTAYLLHASLTMDSNKQIEAHMVKREDADIVSAPFSPVSHSHHWVGVVAPIDEFLSGVKAFPEKTDIWGKAKMASVAGIVQLDYILLLVSN